MIFDGVINLFRTVWTYSPFLFVFGIVFVLSLFYFSYFTKKSLAKRVVDFFFKEKEMKHDKQN